MRKIKWYRLLRERDKRRQFKQRVLEEINIDIEDVQEWWTHNAAVVKKHGKEILGETSGIV